MKQGYKNLTKKKYEYLTFIPARSGSADLKNKNLKTIGNKSLIEITINFIKKMRLKNNFIFVSTDSKKYAKLSKKYGAHANLLRSKKNSKSNSIIDDAIIEFLNHDYYSNYSFKVMILLLPTQPFRDPNHLRKALKLISKKNVNSVISVKNLNRSDGYIFKMDTKKIYIKKNMKATNRQFIKSNFTPCGCFYLTKLEKFKKNKSIFDTKSKGLVTNFPQNHDIDNINDLNLARLIFRNKRKFNLNV